jgi:integrase
MVASPFGFFRFRLVMPRLAAHGSECTSALLSCRHRSIAASRCRPRATPSPATSMSGWSTWPGRAAQSPDLVRVPTPPRRSFVPWSVEDVLAFLSAARSDPLAPAFVLLVASGLRRGEVLGLRWSDVDLEERALCVRQQLQRIDGRLQQVPVKTQRSNRAIPLPVASVRALRKRKIEQLGGSDSGWTGVVGQRAGVHHASRDADRAAQPLARSAGSSGWPAFRGSGCTIFDTCAHRSFGARCPGPHDHGDSRAQPDRGDHERLHACRVGGAAAGHEAHGSAAR